MHGLHCGSCSHGNKPYLTAYEIAVRHGFNGTEEEWIKSIGTVWDIKVLTQTSGTPGSWTCATTFSEMVELAEDRELHLLTLDGKIAILTGMGDDDIVFCTQPYQNSSKDYYDFFIITDENVCTWGTKRFLPASGEVTKTMLNASVQASIDGAIPKSQQVTKDATMTQRVGVDSDGKLYVTPPPTDFIPASVQPSSTGMTCAVGLDANQQLWSEGYTLPDTGIPSTDLASAVKADLNLASILYLPVTVTSGVYDLDTEHMDLRGYNSIYAAIDAGADVRLWIQDSGMVSTPRFVNMPDVSQLVFGGPEYDTFGSGTAQVIYYIIDQNQQHIQRVVKTLS